MQPNHASRFLPSAFQIPPCQIHAVGLDQIEVDLIYRTASSMEIEFRKHEDAEAFLAIESQQPGCLITEIALPGIDGLEFLAQLKNRKSPICPIVVSKKPSVDSVVNAMKLGAAIVVELPLLPPKLRGDLMLALEASERSMQRQQKQQEIQQRLDLLQEDERLILDHIVDGMKNAAIARRLDVSLRTIELRRQRIYLKLEVRSLAELVKIAIESRHGSREDGIWQPPGP